MAKNPRILIRVFGPDDQVDVNLAPGLPVPVPGDAIRTFEPPSLNPTFWRVTERVLFYEAEDEVHVALRAEPLRPQELDWVG